MREPVQKKSVLTATILFLQNAFAVFLLWFLLSIISIVVLGNERNLTLSCGLLIIASYVGWRFRQR